jgi:hypothetical protein
MNEPAHRIRGDETKKPKDDQYDRYGIQHDIFPLGKNFGDAWAVAGSVHVAPHAEQTPGLLKAARRSSERSQDEYRHRRPLLAPIVMMIVAPPSTTWPDKPNAPTQQATEDQDCNSKSTHHWPPSSRVSPLT